MNLHVFPTGFVGRHRSKICENPSRTSYEKSLKNRKKKKSSKKISPSKEPRVRKPAIIFRVILAHDDLRFKSYELKTFRFQLLVQRNFPNFRTFGGPEKIREVVFEKRKNVETRFLTRTSQITCFPPSRTSF